MPKPFSLCASGVLLIMGVSACGSEESTSSAVDTTAAQQLVFNEFNGTGSTEWIELANKSSTAVDLSNYAVADTDKQTHLPKTDAALRFPAGTSIPAEGYLLVITDQQTSGPQAGELCLVGYTGTCYFATFGISAKDGETVHLLASDNSVVKSTEYPKTLLPDSGTGTSQTACRIPDRTGEFSFCTATPGAANTGL